jgi:hypothetical protein
VTNGVDREPDGRKGAEPEEEERHKVLGLGTGAAHGIGDIIEAVPDGPNHQVNTVTSDPCLYSVPDASHRRTVEYRPQTSPVKRSVTRSPSARRRKTNQIPKEERATTGKPMW